MGKFINDTIKLSLNMSGGTINIVAEVEEPYTSCDLWETTIYQRLIITVHPDIQQPGLLHIPIADPKINEAEMEEGVDYINFTYVAVLTAGVVLVSVAEVVSKDSLILQFVKALVSFPLRMIFSTISSDEDDRDR